MAVQLSHGKMQKALFDQINAAELEGNVQAK